MNMSCLRSRMIGQWTAFQHILKSCTAASSKRNWRCINQNNCLTKLQNRNLHYSSVDCAKLDISSATKHGSTKKEITKGAKVTNEQENLGLHSKDGGLVKAFTRMSQDDKSIFESLICTIVDLEKVVKIILDNKQSSSTNAVGSSRYFVFGCQWSKTNSNELSLIMIAFRNDDTKEMMSAIVDVCAL